MSTAKMTFYVKARRVDAHGSLALCKNTEIALDTNLARNPDAFKPAELLLAGKRHAQRPLIGMASQRS
jgi:hypothetical protein